MQDAYVHRAGGISLPRVTITWPAASPGPDPGGRNGAQPRAEPQSTCATAWTLGVTDWKPPVPRHEPPALWTEGQGDIWCSWDSPPGSAGPKGAAGLTDRTLDEGCRGVISPTALTAHPPGGALLFGEFALLSLRSARPRREQQDVGTVTLNHLHTCKEHGTSWLFHPRVLPVQPSRVQPGLEAAVLSVELKFGETR